MRVVTHRIIVTGCRDWSNIEAVYNALDETFQMHEEPARFVIHGDCQSGADRIAVAWCAGGRLMPRARQLHYPADWSRGRKAGPERNQVMANLPDIALCLALWDGASRSMLDMITRAVRSGIPVRIVAKERA